MITTTEQTKDKALQDVGYSLAYDVEDSGSMDRSSTWKVTLSKGNASYTATYNKGPAHRRPRGSKSRDCLPYSPRRTIAKAEKLTSRTEPIPPNLTEVVYSLIADAGCVHRGQTFSEFCNDFGYNDDSRKAKRAFSACQDTWAGLVRLGADFEALETLLEDY